MMLFAAVLIAGIYLFSGLGWFDERRFVSGTSLMLLYLVLYYIFPSDIDGGSIYLGRLSQYLPLLSYGLILFGDAVSPFNKGKNIHWIGLLGLIISSLYHLMFFVIP